MGENEIPASLTPEKKEERKKNSITFTIDLDELYTNIPKIPIPENQRAWNSVEEITPEYQKMLSFLQVLMFYMARTCNEGVEVKDNIAKRMVLVRTLLGIFIDNLNLNGYIKYGMLSEILQDTYLSISGKRQIIKILAKMQTQKDHLDIEKSKEYTS